MSAAQGSRWIPAAVATVSFALGYLAWHWGEGNAARQWLDRTMQRGVVRMARLPTLPPVPVTLVEMEDAENWGALEYSLFLKALPRKRAPVVVFESCPAEGATAFDRSFQQQAITQPRLVLPAILATEDEAAAADFWWLKGWPRRAWEKPAAIYQSVTAAPAEALRGAVAVGVANPPADASQAQLFFPFQARHVPSLALRAMLLARRSSEASLHWAPRLMLGDERLPVGRDGILRIDALGLARLRRVPASNLLLRLAGSETEVSQPPAISPEQMRGVLILGDLSENARTLRVQNAMLTPAEWTALSVDALCNHPLLTAPGIFGRTLLLLLCAAAPLLFWSSQTCGKWLGLLYLLAMLGAAAIYFASQHALAIPFAIPALILLLGTGLCALFTKPPVQDYARI